MENEDFIVPSTMRPAQRRHAGLREDSRPRSWTRASPTVQDQCDERLDETANEAMDGRRHGQGALRFSATAQDQCDKRLEANYERGNGRPATWSRCS